MVIGFDGSRAFTGQRTGTENYSYQLLKNLAKIDRINQYIVYLRPLGTQGVPLQGWPDNFRFRTINWLRLWTQGGLAIQTFRDNLDVLFVPAHTLPVIRYPGLKTVVTVHDLGSEYLSSMHQIKQRIYLGFMQRYQLKTATKIIAVSKATKNNLVKKTGIDQRRIEVIYEGYDQNLFRPVKFDLLVNSLSHYGLKPGKYFLFVGTVQPRKNLERLIKAFAKFAARRSAKNRSYGRDLLACENFVEDRYPQSLRKSAQNPQHFLTTCDFAALKLIIVGGKGWMSEKIYALPKQLGIEDRVKFLGYVPVKDLPALYSGAIALTFPSLFEGFGLPILEAQACGCPVLTSNISSMPEVAGLSDGGGAIFVDPYSTSDIVKGMVEIMNKDMKRRIIEAGFLNIKRFSWERCARGTLKVLEAL
ncbi:MAG: glycosyltransferase family 1 protein [Candidatus Daviesbacteria bacterium]|nr:glycosyltransferase family 1 protein [Candidatus Daviesbacteria bacterium]